MAIRAVLFDKDGTLFAFDATWGRVIESVLDRIAAEDGSRDAMARAVGYDPERQRFLPGSPFVAGAAAETAAIWAGFRPDLRPQAIEALTNEVAAAMTGPGALVPAVADLPGYLAGLGGRGLALGVATHDSAAAAEAHLAAAGARDAFAFVAGYDSGFGLKPGPGMVLAFARAVNVDPQGVAMVGDSVHDLMAARAAGAALAVGVLTGPADHDDLGPHADHVIASIADLPALLG